MTNLSGRKRAHYVQEMFARIAPRYDLMNRLMTAGQDIAWRREVIHRTKLPKSGRLLDLGAGTGDLGREAYRQFPECQAILADFTLEMMKIGLLRQPSNHLNWLASDASSLPFPAQSFDAVVSGFLLRNVSDIDQTLLEQYRVLKPGGRIGCLDTTRPKKNLLSPLINVHLNMVIPAVGEIVAGEPDAYTYLPDSTKQFMDAEQLAARMLAAGFKRVGFRRIMFGTIAIHWGIK